MAKLDDLSFDPKAGPNVDMENLPEEFADFGPPPYPGLYTFQLPYELDFEPFKATVLGVKDQERVRVNFDAAHPLMVVAATPENAEEVGKMITMYRISNSEYEMTRKGEKVTHSEMAHLLKGAFKETGLKPGMSNKAWAEALNRHAGETFGAKVEWEAYCNPDKRRWVVDAETGARSEDNADGCSRRYAQSGYKKGDGTEVLDIPKEVGVDDAGVSTRELFAWEFSCVCGAALRVRPRVRQYGPVSIQPATLTSPA